METTVLALGSTPLLSFLAWIIFGLVVGLIVVLVLPEDARPPTVLLCGAGVVGALVGGWILALFGVDAVGNGLWFTVLTCLIGAVLAVGAVMKLGRQH
ncbi:GlsB/YeaQ/YmgE family stress response membrane protein [Corynebacterium terpenotabidum]|uniref:GlsB/YeaQ/YmgE family stress response membrane protein n=1 Tax=Corynebacterium terpenotabidum Y-11 TaxID=1200352 RepID=S4XGV6_9CORY|nr:GlsB/YeaQ/YmgE family stress response membrane protein [Corynebacterium terpenotabidum]AGP31819.1 hypothetical protein A606_10900 [Corynebacterium terpenotabidum Y-11]